MPDSLFFDGTDDNIDFGNGGLGVYGPGTIGIIMKMTAAVAAGQNHYFFFNGSWNVLSTDSEIPGLELSSGFASYDGNPFSIDVWEALFWTKATGTVVPDCHQYDGTTWTHNAGSGSIANSSDPTSIKFGGSGFANEWFQGNILIAGYWNTVLSNGAIEALTNYAAWVSAAPIEAWRFDTMSAIQSFGTTGGSDESARTGTTLDTGDAPTWWSEGAAQEVRPDADVTTTGWTTTPLFSKINDESDATVITSTAS